MKQLLHSTVIDHSARRSLQKAWRQGMRLNRVFVRREQQLQNAEMFRFAKKALFSLI